MEKKMIERGPWKVVQSREVYRDPWIGVRVDDVIRPDGKPGIHSIIDIKPGVCVLAMDADGSVYLTEEFHYAVGRVTLEAVSGGIEAGETPLDTAQRELREELGIVAGKWTELGVVDPFTANVVSPTRLFLAQELTFAETKHEGTELIRSVRVPLIEAMRMLEDGRITHGPTCVLLLKAYLMAG
jgi:ADP-ribose pyrophosphatase